MPGKRISSKSHVKIQILREEGYSSRQIVSRLKLYQKTVSRSINNYKTSVNYSYKIPSGPPKVTNKLTDDAIIIASQKSPRKSSKAIQAGLPRDTSLPS